MFSKMCFVIVVACEPSHIDCIAFHSISVGRTLVGGLNRSRPWAQAQPQPPIKRGRSDTAPAPVSIHFPRDDVILICVPFGCMRRALWCARVQERGSFLWLTKSFALRFSLVTFYNFCNPESLPLPYMSPSGFLRQTTRISQEKHQFQLPVVPALTPEFLDPSC